MTEGSPKAGGAGHSQFLRALPGSWLHMMLQGLLQLTTTPYLCLSPGETGDPPTSEYRCPNQKPGLNPGQQRGWLGSPKLSGLRRKEYLGTDSCLIMYFPLEVESTISSTSLLPSPSHSFFSSLLSFSSPPSSSSPLPPFLLHSLFLFFSPYFPHLPSGCEKHMGLVSELCAF